jgi:hypothetical protein
VQGVIEGVKQLAEIFQYCVATSVWNDKQLFSRLEIKRKENIKKYVLKDDLRPILFR